MRALNRILHPLILIWSFSLICQYTCAAVAAAQNSALIPDALIQVPENEHVVIVEKNTQTLYVYAWQRDRGGILKPDLVFNAPCSTGEVAGDKTRSGDKKTPEGVYFLKDEYEDKYLTPVYGKKAFPTDYPNFLDQRLGKSGSAIWIHGTNKKLKPMDSNGCIALENKNVMALADYIRLNATPLIIFERLDYTTPGALEEERNRFANFLNQWASDLEQGSVQDFLAHYDASSLQDMGWWESWLNLRTSAMSADTPFSIHLENTGIYGHKDIVVAFMDMTLETDGERLFLGKRQLFIRGSGKHPLIIGDFFQKRAPGYEGVSDVLCAAAGDMLNDIGGNKEVLTTVKQWLAAWSAKDMDGYANFYSSDFFSDGLGKKAWVSRKKSLAGQYNYITVTGANYKVIKEKGGYTVRFLQNYNSSGFSAQGEKQLMLVKKGGEWKISQERWIKK